MGDQQEPQDLQDQLGLQDHHHHHAQPSASHNVYQPVLPLAAHKRNIKESKNSSFTFAGPILVPFASRCYFDYYNVTKTLKEQTIKTIFVYFLNKSVKWTLF